MKKLILLLIISIFFSISIFSKDLIAPLTIKTTPENVEVFINDISQGYTPITISSLLKGVYLLSLQKNDYEPQTFFIDLTDESTTELNIVMNKINSNNKINKDESIKEHSTSFDQTQIILPKSFFSSGINLKNLLVSQLSFGINPQVTTIYPLNIPMKIGFMYTPLKNLETFISSSLSITINDSNNISNLLDCSFLFGCKYIDKKSIFNYGGSIAYLLDTTNLEHTIDLQALTGVNYSSFSTFLSIGLDTSITTNNTQYSFTTKIQEQFSTQRLSILGSFSYKYPRDLSGQIELAICSKLLPFAYKVKASMNITDMSFSTYCIEFGLEPYYLIK